jgi:hypothetical protein
MKERSSTDYADYIARRAPQPKGILVEEQAIPELRRSEMFIALNTKKTIAPFGGAEVTGMSTHQVEFRPSER